jgi:DNA-binding PadR family transcriptional regulator
LLEATETVQRDAPTKRVYQITLAGSNEFQRWLDDAALTEERSRNLFLVRILFGDRTSRERLAAF